MASNQPVGEFSDSDSSTAGWSVEWAQRVALASTRRIAGWRYTGYVSCPGLVN